MFADYKKINDDVKRLIELGAPESDIDTHIEQSGGNVKGLRRYNKVKDKTLGEIISDNFVNALKETYSEGASPVAKGIDTFAFGLPRTVLKAFNPELDKQLFPDQKTLNGKVANVSFNVAGLLVGGAAKAMEASGKLIPKVAGEGLKRQIVRGSVQGAVGAGSQFMGDPAEGIVEQVGRQGVQSLFGGLLGGALPVAGKGLSYVKGVVTDFKKGAQGYISDVIAPKMEIVIKNQIQKMDPKFVNYVEKKLKISKNALDIIRRKGEAVLDEVFAMTRGSADDIENRLRVGLAERGKIADDAYGQVMQQVPDEQIFNANKTQNALRRDLMDKGYLTGAGERTARVSIAPGPDKILLDVHDDILRTQSPTKNDFIFWREKLSSAYKEVGYTNIGVKNAIDNLYDDAVNSGYNGMQEARALYRAQIEAEKRFAKSSLLNTKKLNKYDRWTSTEKQELNDLVSYIQDDFPLDAGIIDDLEATVASNELQVLKQKTSANTIKSDLLRAKNKENFSSVRNEWIERVGDDAVPIFNELQQSMRGQTIRRVAEKAIIPLAASAGVAFAGYGAYRLGSEALHDLIGNIGE